MGAGALAAGAAKATPAGLTDFQIACMTLPYSAYPFERALKGIAGAGYRYVAWGNMHEKAPLVPEDAPASAARDLGAKTRDAGLEPVMMFGVVYIATPNAVEVYKRRVQQAAAAKLPFVLAFGDIRGTPDLLPAWTRDLKAIGPMARDAGVMVVIKQHGGNTATGKQCARIVEDVNDDGVRMFYDAGNTWWYPNVDPLPDIPTCAQHVRGFCIKDFRDTPKRAICGAGFGQIDHYKLLAPVLKTGLKMPLACENIAAPYVKAATPEDLDALARRSREYLESVTRGLQAAG
jgi:sugar phosphate isomerase/epimerase